MNVTPRPSAELTLEDAWANSLIERHPRLNRMLALERLADLGETAAAPELDTMLVPIFDAVREFEFVRTAGQIRAVDEARLFEALVYRIGRYLFGNDEDVALAAHDRLLPRVHAELAIDDPNPIGTTYRRRLAEVGIEDEQHDPEGVWRDEVINGLHQINRDEAVWEYGEVARRGRALCFCAALWALETKQGANASVIALKEEFRRSLSGDVIALFFRARALLTSSVTSPAQTQLGLRFVTTALGTYPRNPGMHHTKAVYLFRKAVSSEARSVIRACLDQALESVDAALLWDAEFPTFYATRAMIKHRMNDRAEAQLDLHAAIELARYSDSAPLQREANDWKGLLNMWQLEPVDLTSSQ